MTELPKWAVEGARELSAMWNDPGQESAIAHALAEAAKPEKFIVPPGKSMTLRLDANGDLHVSIHERRRFIVMFEGFNQENHDARDARMAISASAAPEVE